MNANVAVIDASNAINVSNTIDVSNNSTDVSNAINASNAIDSSNAINASGNLNASNPTDVSGNLNASNPHVNASNAINTSGNLNASNVGGKKVETVLRIRIPNLSDIFGSVKMPTNPIPGMIEKVKQKLTDINNLKFVVISLVNVLATKKGQELFKSLLKVIDPTMKMLTDEILKNVEKNKPEMVKVINELGQPVSQAIRETMGTVPGLGEGLAAYLALKNAILSSLNGANVASSFVDNLVVVPVSNVLKPTQESIKHAYELGNDLNNLNGDLKNMMELFNQVNCETEKLQKMSEKGSSVDSLLNVPDDNAPINNEPINNAKKVGGRLRHSRHIIKKITRRIKKWVRRFKNTRKR